MRGFLTLKSSEHDLAEERGSGDNKKQEHAVKRRDIRLKNNMKVLWPPPSIGPLGGLELSPSSSSHSSLLSLCLSVYSAGCVRKGNSAGKRSAKNEIVLPKGFDLDEVTLHSLFFPLTIFFCPLHL